MTMSPARYVITDPPITRSMFAETGAWTWVWALVRVYIGYEWLTAGWHKVTDPAWTAGGSALKSYLEKAVMIPLPPARPQVNYGWYRDFLEGILSGGHYSWMAQVVAYGEVLVGIALILGAFVGIAAYFGAFMNFNFLLAGSVSSNPILFIGAIFLMLAWKNAGYWGLDRWLLRRLGTPWSVRVAPAPVTNDKVR